MPKEIKVNKKSIQVKDRDSLKVVKHYELVDAGYHISTRANIFIGFLIAQIDSMGQDEILPYEYTWQEIKNVINTGGVRRVSNRSEVVTIMNELNSKPIYFKEYEENEVVADNWITWISKLRYVRKKDTYSFTITSDLHTLLLKLGTNPETGETRPFVAWGWLLSTTFKCDYSIVFYELFSKRLRADNSVKIELTIDKIKFKGQVGKKYPRYYDLKKNIIEPICKDISESPISFFSASWEVGRKKGKAVQSIIFNITRKTVTKVLPSAPVESFYIQIEQLTIKWKTRFSKEYIDKLLNDGNTSEQIRRAIETTNNNIESGKKITSTEIAYFSGILKNVISQGELFSDPVQDGKNKQKERKIEAQNRREKQKKAEKIIDLLREKMTKIRIEILEDIQTNHIDLWAKVKEESQAISFYDKTLSWSENMERNSFKFVPHQILQKMMPNRYEESQQIVAQIDKLKKENGL